jgi:transposase-like protein
MEESIKSLYIKYSQKDYSMSFKLSVVRKVNSGSIEVKAAARKYEIQGHDAITEWRRKFSTFAIRQIHCF